MKNFESYFKPHQDKYQSIRLTPGVKRKVSRFVDQLLQVKLKEHVHKIDGDVERKRWITGVSGEMAVEQLIGIRFFDWSIGSSDQYDVSDLEKMGLNVGIKTVEYGKFPVVHKRSKRPEIIVVKDQNTFYICGLATVDTLNQYQDDSLILNKKLRARNVKTGFYGFDALLPIHSLDDLKKHLA